MTLGPRPCSTTSAVTAAPAVPHIRSGALVAIAVSTPQRARALPDVPSVAETFPDYDVTNWEGVLFPAGTDAAIIEDHSTPIAAAPTFDTKAFDGRYAADNTTLDINADGTYALSIDGNATDGTWTLQKGGKKVTLDPNSKGETDRQLDIESNDSVKIVGGATLTRQADTK